MLYNEKYKRSLATHSHSVILVRLAEAAVKNSRNSIVCTILLELSIYNSCNKLIKIMLIDFIFKKNSKKW